MHTVSRKEFGSKHTQASHSSRRALAGGGGCIGDFLRGLLQVRVYRNGQFARKRNNALERGVAHGVRRVRREAKRQQRLISKCIARGEADADVGICVGRVVRRKIDNAEGEHRALPHGQIRLSTRLRIKVHIHAGRRAAQQHFGCREFGARVYKRVIEQRLFHRPDAFAQPPIER